MNVHGLLLVDKPAGPTSFDVIRSVRRALKTRKVGHTGTLDPDATGLLPIAIGNATRFAQFLILDDKEYTFDLVLGRRTTTDDATGETMYVREVDVSKEQLDSLLPQFTGEIMQAPPRFSAVHVNGRRAYDLAREGVEFELPTRPVRVDSITVKEFGQPVSAMHVACGSGTYVRGLARDIGEALGVGGHASAIRRTRVGGFSVEAAVSLADLESGAFDLGKCLLGLGSMLLGMPRRDATEAEARAIRFGQLISLGDAPLADHVAIYTPEQELLGIAVPVEKLDGWWLQPRRVVPTNTD